MAYIDFKQLKARVPLSAILDHYGLLTQFTESPQGYEGTCPFCGSNAFKANTEKNAWFCFGECKTHAETQGGHNGGNMLDFVARREGVSVKKAAALVTEWFPPDGTPPPKSQGESDEQPATQGRAEHKEPDANQEGENVPKQDEDTDLCRVPPALCTPKSSTVEDLSNRINKPLDFTLKSIDVEHPVLTELGLKPETLAAFNVGYFTGKGIMHNQVVIPFHDADGRLIAYVGYNHSDHSYRYPPNFDRRLELFNALRAENTGLLEDRLVLVTDLLQVCRLYELGVYRVVALPSDILYAPQLVLLKHVVGEGGQIDLASSTEQLADILAALLPHFYVRLHELTGNEEELEEVAASLGW